MNINGKVRLLNKLVFEARYAFGYTYLDRCGKVINALSGSGWFLTGSATPQSVTMLHSSNRTTLTITPTNLSVSLEQQYGKAALQPLDVNALALLAGQAFETVATILELREFLRVGFRIWNFFGTNSTSESESWLRDLALYEMTPRFRSLVDKGEVEARSLTAVFVLEDRKLRLLFGGVEMDAVLDLDDRGYIQFKPRNLPKGQRRAYQEQAAQKRQIQQNPSHAAVVDIDAFLEDPPIVDAEHFIRSSFDLNEATLKKFKRSAK